MNIPTETVPSPERVPVRQALLAANGQVIQHGGKRWKIEARETRAIYPSPHTAFSCVAQDLDPKDEDEARYCIMDLWQSESARAARILAKAVEIGCRLEHATI